MFWKWKKKSEKEDELLILFGTRSGNSKLIAKQAEHFYRKNGMKVNCMNMSEYNPEKLPEVKKLLAIVSTQGEGEPPEQAKKFFLKLMNNGLSDLSNLRYSVCALGDSGYEHFCKTGKDLDQRLSQLGATPVLPRVDCDVEFSENAARWIKESLKVFSKQNGQIKGAAVNTGLNGELISKPRFSARIISKKKLTADSAQADVYHVSLEITSSGFTYSAGDSIEILPKNPQWLADKILKFLQLNSPEFRSWPVSELKSFLLVNSEITRISAGTLKRYQEVANNEQLGLLLKNKQECSDYLSRANLLDLLSDFPCTLSPEQFFGIPAHLTPRAYSIASGPRLNQQHFDLVIKTIRYRYKNQLHEGSGSVYLTEELQPGSMIEFSLEENPEFHLPEDSKIPIIMIGVGTGIAPFRAFLQERASLDSKNNTWLIWGAKKQACDSLYKTELELFKTNQVLERLDMVFSKDEYPRKYVQDILVENKDEIVNWLERGAYIYVCGSIAMGKGVKSCLNEFLKDTSFESVENLQILNRFKADVY
ncbi:MAG: diflavin oxidoreductase [Mariniphaga sp.]